MHGVRVGRRGRERGKKVLFFLEGIVSFIIIIFIIIIKLIGEDSPTTIL